MTTEPKWELLKPEEFEEVTYALVKAMGFIEPKRAGGVGDCGKDIIAFQPANQHGIGTASRQWVFQCKRQKKLTKLEIQKEISNFAGNHIDTWVLVTTASVTVPMSKWFETLSQSRSAPFYVVGWWRKELNDFVREYSNQLLKLLPPNIIKILGLRNYVRYSTSITLETLIAKSRNFVTAQIKRFAQSKYVEGLYVHRKLEEILKLFHSSEYILAKTLKGRVSNIIAEHIKIIEEKRKLLFLFKEYLVDSEISKSNIDDISREICSYAEYISSTIKILLNKALNEASHMSDVALIGQGHIHFKIENATKKIIDFLLKECSIFRPVNWQEKKKTIESIRKELENLKREDLIKRIDKLMSAFSPDGFSSLTSQMESCFTDIQHACRNCILVVDRAGGGKTNIMCQVGTLLASQGPTILLFGRENYVRQEDLIEKISEFASSLVEIKGQDGLIALDEFLESSGLFLNVLIDGINESRDIVGADLSILCFLEWSSKHRIRVSITCRDIYFDFFEHEKWEEFINQFRKNELYEFYSKEYEEAIPLYFEHFKIRCKLLESAKEACQHPLLLRFFCEAYGEPNGKFVNLGLVRDIRLKELFDEYLAKKINHIRHFLHHINSEKVEQFLFSIANYMFSNRSATMLTSEIEKASGYADTYTTDSIYLRLLDEDIIIEEEPTDKIDIRRVSFVYEEFMEYMIANSFLYRLRNIGKAQMSDYFLSESKKLGKWVNFRGVAEYIVLMLLGSNNPTDINHGIDLLKTFLKMKNTWVIAFWSVIAKVPESALIGKLFDVLHEAMVLTSSYSDIKRALTVMARLSEDGTKKLASVVLWSGLLPSVLRWSDFNIRNGMLITDLNELETRLVNAYQEGIRSEHVVSNKSVSNTKGYRQLCDMILPYLKKDIALKMEERLNERGKPGKSDFVHTMRIIRDLFPLYQVYLLNGIFHNDDNVAEYCANNIKFAPKDKGAIAYLCKSLSKIETRETVRDFLLNSANTIERNN